MIDNHQQAGEWSACFEWNICGACYWKVYHFNGHSLLSLMRPTLMPEKCLFASKEPRGKASSLIRFNRLAQIPTGRERTEIFLSRGPHFYGSRNFCGNFSNPQIVFILAHNRKQSGFGSPFVVAQVTFPGAERGQYGDTITDY